MKPRVTAWLFASIVSVMPVAQDCRAEGGRCDDERRSARLTARKILDEWPIRERDFLTDYVDRIARRIIDRSRLGNAPWRIFVVRNLSANGFSVGDGYLFVNEGALLRAETESQFAAVLAHEIGHEVVGHFCRSNGESFPWDWNPFSGDKQPEFNGRSSKLGSIHQVVDPIKELEADRRALDLLWIAGFDPRAMLQVARRVTAETGASDQSGESRVAELERILESIHVRNVADSEEFLWIKQQLQRALR
ncbi:MAG: M48 family metallopeptidase [Methylococcaceae bacterium]|nr:M48 family metallopeptidase [Methylococcaceae bacterium]